MDKPTEIRVVSAVADKKQAVLYLDDGNQIILKQGDHRLGDLLDIIIPITSKGETAVISLEDFSVYAAFEKKTTGLTRFFKVAKDKVKGFFGGQTDTHKAVIPEEGKLAIIKAVMGETMTEAEVLEHGKPMDMADDLGPDEVVVAVVTTPAVPATPTAPAQPARTNVIPGVQSLKPLITHAVSTNSAQSVQNFLTRCAAFIDKRQHSVDDLMRFLEKGDLPLAEDGSIIAYKMLNWHDQAKGIMKDCHTGKIQQKVGSYVCVNESLVDLNRRNECSNGLHIARRGYLSSFSGNVCVVCKIDPEDVMVVPHNDANKVRVKGYHILGYLSEEATKHLKAGKPATSDHDALKLVFDAIKGDHIDRLERVQVNGQAGTNVTITKIKDADKDHVSNVDVSTSEMSVAKALDSEDKPNGAVDVREINKKVTAALEGKKADLIITDGVDDQGTEPEYENEDDIEQELADATAEALNIPHSELNPDAGVGTGVGKSDPQKADAFFAKPKSIKEQLADLILDFDTSPSAAEAHKAAQAIVTLKKGAKKGWDKLGVDADKAAIYERTAGTVPAPEIRETGTKEKKAKPEKVAAKEPSKPKTVKATPPAKSPVAPTASKTPTKAEEARALYDANKLDDLRAFKKRVKKGWNVLGFSPSEIAKIEK